MLKPILLLVFIASTMYAAEKIVPHTEPFIGQSATVPLTTKGKAAGTADLLFTPETIESAWLKSHGFAKVTYVTNITRKVANGTHYSASSQGILNAKGDQLMINVIIKGDRFVMDGTISLIRKSGTIETFAFSNVTPTKSEPKK